MALRLVSVCLIQINSDDLGAIWAAIVMLALLSVGIWWISRRLRFRYAPSRWIMADGLIQSEFATNPTNPGAASVLGGHVAAYAASHQWKSVLQYSYQVAGEFYSGYVMLRESYSSREDASTAAQPWLKKKIIVRYNPKKPYESAFLIADGAPQGCRSLGDQPPASQDVITLSLK
jgi:hypothetical protein